MSELNVNSGKAEVSISHTKKGKVGEKTISFEHETEILDDVPFFPEGYEPARVSAGMEYSRQIRQFEPVKVSVHVSMPCKANESSVLECYEKVSKIVESKMGQAINTLSNLVGKSNG